MLDRIEEGLSCLGLEGSLAWDFLAESVRWGRMPLPLGRGVFSAKRCNPGGVLMVSRSIGASINQTFIVSDMLRSDQALLP